MTVKKIGIVGIGLMGHGIASNIQKKGWKIGFFEHSGNQPCNDLTKAGATAYQSLSRLSIESDVIILCVTGSPQVEKVLTGEDGILSSLRPGTVVIDCSTAVPGSTVKLANEVHSKGGRFLDAPMTRLPKDAAAGTLNLIVGGDRALFEEQAPLLQTFAENITYAGEVGMGHTMKLLHNYVSLGFSAVLAEAAATASRSGIDPEVFQQVLKSGGGAGVVLDRLTPFICEQEVGSYAFTLANSSKDIGYYTQMCTELDAHSVVADAVGQSFTTQVHQGNGDAYVPYLIKFLSNQV